MLSLDLHFCLCCCLSVPVHRRAAPDCNISPGHMTTVKYISKSISPFVQEDERVADKGKSIEMQVNTWFLNI